MKKPRLAFSNWLLNATLAVLGLVALFLLYALVMRAVQPRIDPEREGAGSGLVGEIIQVEVLNGCGEPGLAGEVTRFLRGRGFDVVSSGDRRPFDQAETVVLDRVGDPAAARKVALALGLPETRVLRQIERGLYLDASVIIGRDYETLVPFRK